jgi:two-component system, LytTR family, sensor kinase
MAIFAKSFPADNPLFQWRYHAAFWHFYMLLINTSAFTQNNTTTTSFIDFYIYCLLVILLVVYGQCFALFFYGKNIYYQIAISIGTFLLYYAIRVARNEFLISIDITPFYTISTDVLISSFVNWFFFSAFGLGLYIAISTIERQAQLIDLEKAQIEKDLEILNEKKQNYQLFINNQKAELNKLKAQINPHFLFNSLNFFYSEVRPINKKIAESIMLLSDILRYSLIEHGTNDLVDIEEEVEYLKNYITLQRNRFYDNFFLNLEVDWQDNIKNKKIPSMVLLTLVENCFKYGDLHDAENPCQIKVSVNNDIFTFIVKNKILPKNSTTISTGIGLDNIKNRLLLIYGKNKHTIVTNSNFNTYVCQVQLTLNNI